MKSGLLDHGARPRTAWLLNHSAQVVSTVNQIVWCRGVETSLRDKDVDHTMQAYHQRLVSELHDLTTLVRSDLQPLQRAVIVALVTADVHGRDIGAVSLCVSWLCCAPLTHLTCRFRCSERACAEPSALGRGLRLAAAASVLLGRRVRRGRRCEAVQLRHTVRIRVRRRDVALGHHAAHGPVLDDIDGCFPFEARREPRRCDAALGRIKSCHVASSRW
jgi:hypothetical protein